jgi:hypothetical protein
MRLLFLLWLWIVKENCIVAMMQFVIVRTQGWRALHSCTDYELNCLQKESTGAQV